MKTRINILVVVLAMLFQSGCMYAVRYDGAYQGRIIDEATREPIEGVVVLGVWYKTAPTVAGAVSTYYDARETVTDKNGEFKIPGQGLRIMTDLAPMEILIFKVGYDYIGLGPWEGLKKSITLSKKVRWEGERPIIPLKKLTMEERKIYFPPSPPHEAPLYKINLMLREINKNATELGAEPITIWQGDKL